MSDVEQTAIPCPFIYAKGRQCCGVIYRAVGYGPRRNGDFVFREDVRKYRLWCSEKDDHAGSVPTFEGKMRMEFYPDELAPGVEDRLWARRLVNE
jgi:hypothetical protein